MRGDLRISSRFAPFRRAGLAWSDVNAPVEISILDLDGARLLALINEPALRIEGKPDDGDKWQPLPTIVDPTAAGLQMMIDALRAELPARPADEKPFTVADALAERDGVQVKLGETEAKLFEVTGQLETANATISDLRGKLSTADTDRVKSAAEIEQLKSRIAELEKALADANAKHDDPKPTTKAKAGSKPPAEA